VNLLPGIGDGTFGAAEPHDAGELPAGMVIADLNGDLIPDLAVTSRYTNDVSIIAASSTGDGSLIVMKDFDVGDWPRAVLAADVNEDGILDLITGSSLASEVEVLIGTGTDSTWDGGFLPGVPYDSGLYTTSIAGADFNEDGILDLVTTNRLTHDMTVLLGNGSGGVGDGTFQVHVAYSEGMQQRSVVALDFNGDDMLDIFCVGYESNNLIMYMGNGTGGIGDGTFTLLGTRPLGNGPQYIAAGDYNGDGILDLAIPQAHNNNLVVLTGGGAGGVWDSTFATAGYYPVGDFPTCIAAADFDEDGILDLVTTDHLSDQVSVLIGSGAGGVGDGAFAPAVPYTTGAGPRRVTIADFDGDGLPDIAVTCRFSDDFSILTGLGDGGFSEEERFDAGTEPWAIIAPDLNRDGAPDLVITNRIDGDASVMINMSCVYVGVDNPGTPRPLFFKPYSAPNPFNPATRLHFVLGEPGEVAVDIYDVRGRLVRNLLRDYREPGKHEILWNGADRSGNPAGSGLYFFMVRSGNRVSTGKMILTR